MGKFKDDWNSGRSVLHRMFRWIAFWLVAGSAFMIIGAPSKEKK